MVSLETKRQQKFDIDVHVVWSLKNAVLADEHFPIRAFHTPFWQTNGGVRGGVLAVLARLLHHQADIEQQTINSLISVLLIADDVRATPCRPQALSCRGRGGVVPSGAPPTLSHVRSMQSPAVHKNLAKVLKCCHARPISHDASFANEVLIDSD